MGSSERIVFTDLETMGLQNGSPVVEVAMVACEADLTVIAERSEVVAWDRRDWATASDFALSMHEKSGLRAESEALGPEHTLFHVEQRTLKWLRDDLGFAPQEAVIAGNSIGQDRIWIACQMPMLNEYLSHRMIDVSGIRLLIQRWVDQNCRGPSSQESVHRALADARWSRDELLFYKKALFDGREAEIKQLLTITPEKSA